MWYSNKCPFCNFCFCLKRSFCNCSCSCGYVTYWYSGKSSRCAPVWIWERAEWELYWASVMFLAWGLPVLGRFLGMTQFWFRFSDDETCSLGGGLYLNWECSLRNFCFAFLENACWCAAEVYLSLNLSQVWMWTALGSSQMSGWIGWSHGPFISDTKHILIYWWWRYSLHCGCGMHLLLLWNGK